MSIKNILFGKSGIIQYQEVLNKYFTNRLCKIFRFSAGRFRYRFFVFRIIEIFLNAYGL